MRSVLKTMVPSSTVDVFCHLFSTGPTDVGSMLTPTLPLFLVLFFNDQASVGSRFNPALRWVLADTGKIAQVDAVRTSLPCFSSSEVSARDAALSFLMFVSNSCRVLSMGV